MNLRLVDEIKIRLDSSDLLEKITEVITEAKNIYEENFNNVSNTALISTEELGKHLSEKKSAYEIHKCLVESGFIEKLRKNNYLVNDSSKQYAFQCVNLVFYIDSDVLVIVPKFYLKWDVFSDVKQKIEEMVKENKNEIQ